MHRYITPIAVLASFAGLVTMGACAVPQEDEVDQPVGEAKEALSVPKLLYEGTCAHLRAKSIPSQNIQSPNVMWGCTGVGYCDDNTKWVAAPTKANCGDTVQVCSGGSCTQALVKDVSDTAKFWEAGNAVMNAILPNVPYGTLTNNVTVSVLSAGCHGQYAGYYCGGDNIGGNSNYLYYCSQKYAQPALQVCCAHGCQPAGANQNDYCK
jgi:hypothetical protein